jgi:hypothetical protein
MDYRDYFQKLLWQQLLRNEKFQKLCKTKDPKLKTEIEKQYEHFKLKIDPSKELWISFNPSPLRILSPGFSDKVVFEIDLDKFKYTSDYKQLFKEIESKLKFEIRLKKEANDHNPILNYRPEQTFDRDLEILAFWEELPNRPIKDIADKFDMAESSARKALKRIYELVYEKPYHSKIKSQSIGFPCNDCPREKKVMCKGNCNDLETFLTSETIGSGWREILETDIKEDDDQTEYTDKYSFQQWQQEKDVES